MRKGFTLIELLVVIAMIAILTGAASSSVMRARTRSQIARATTEVREMTNAILAYENYDKNHSLQSIAAAKAWAPASEGALGFILGGEAPRVPVLYTGAVTRGYVMDPWNMPYEFMVAKAGDASDSDDNVGDSLSTFMYLPNLNRLTPEEMGLR